MQKARNERIKYSDLQFLTFRLTVQRFPNVLVLQFQGYDSIVAMADEVANAANQIWRQFEVSVDSARRNIQSIPL